MKESIKTIGLFIILALVSVAGFAGALTDYAENLSVDNMFRGVSYSATTPANYHVALATSACSDSASGTEVTGGSYARVAIARATGTWNGTHGNTTGASSGTNGTISNASPITFSAATADWGTVSHWEIKDANTAGNAIVCAALTSSRTITNGSTPAFAAGALTVQVDN